MQVSLGVNQHLQVEAETHTPADLHMKNSASSSTSSSDHSSDRGPPPFLHTLCVASACVMILLIILSRFIERCSLFSFRSRKQLGGDTFAQQKRKKAGFCSSSRASRRRHHSTAFGSGKLIIGPTTARCIIGIREEHERASTIYSPVVLVYTKISNYTDPQSSSCSQHHCSNTFKAMTTTAATAAAAFCRQVGVFGRD